MVKSQCISCFMMYADFFMCKNLCNIPILPIICEFDILVVQSLDTSKVYFIPCIVRRGSMADRHRFPNVGAEVGKLEATK